MEMLVKGKVYPKLIYLTKVITAAYISLGLQMKGLSVRLPGRCPTEVFSSSNATFLHSRILLNAPGVLILSEDQAGNQEGIFPLCQVLQDMLGLWS